MSRLLTAFPTCLAQEHDIAIVIHGGAGASSDRSETAVYRAR
jgi:hypothetical protein